MSPRRARKGYRIIFLTVFAISLLAEILLFLYFQIGEINSLIREDFAVVFVRDGRAGISNSSLRKEIESLPGVESVKFVSADKKLDELKIEDEDFSKSVLLLGKNFLPDTFEVKVAQSVIGDFEEWVRKAAGIKGVESVEYKQSEVFALLHAAFYENLIYMTFAVFVSALALMVIMALAYKFEINTIAARIMTDINWFLSGALGSFAAAAVSYAIVYPIKYLSPIWNWPNPLWQIFIIFSGGFIGWVIYQWKTTH